MYLIGIDDTDNLESRGTGHLARAVAAVLAEDHSVLGVTRHQLLVDDRVPCTRNNSCAAIIIEANSDLDPDALFDQVRTLMLDDWQPGSDPGLCVAPAVPQVITEFGRQVQSQLVSQDQARALAASHGIPLLGLGGTEDGVIGALAAVGLAAGGDDGRYVLVGRSRELDGLQTVAAILEAGIVKVQTLDGETVTGGLVQTDRMRPARRGSQPILFVERSGDHWLPLKLD